jgi:hypothetical protein
VTDTKEKQCETCIEGKMTRCSFQTKNQPTELSIQPGEVWSIDLGFVKNSIYVNLWTMVMKSRIWQASKEKMKLLNHSQHF